MRSLTRRAPLRFPRRETLVAEPEAVTLSPRIDNRACYSSLWLVLKRGRKRRVPNFSTEVFSYAAKGARSRCLRGENAGNHFGVLANFVFHIRPHTDENAVV